MHYGIDQQCVQKIDSFLPYGLIISQQPTHIFGGGCVCGGNFCYHSSMDDCFRPQLFIPCRRLTELLKLNASGLYTLFTIFKYYYCDLLLLCQTSGKTTKSNWNFFKPKSCPFLVSLTIILLNFPNLF